MKLRAEVYDKISSEVIVKSIEVTKAFKASVEYEYVFLL